MLLTKLPLELVHEIIAIAVISEDTPSGALRLREVNHLFNEEVFRGFIRHREHSFGKAAWGECPYSFRVRWVRDLVIGPKRKANTEIVSYWKEVVDVLEKYSNIVSSENGEVITRQQWFDECCEVLALPEADCQCGKPAFYHLARYDQQIRESAFHVAFLKGHTDIEKAMIKDGLNARSDCPYIQVHLHACRWQRKNALQWAMQEGLTNTVMRLLEAMDDDQKNLGDWDTALQIVASRNNMQLVEYFLAPEFSSTRRDSRGISDDTLALATREASQYGHWEVFHKIYDERPHQLDCDVIGNAAETDQWDILDKFLRKSEGLNERALSNYFNRALTGAARRGHAGLYHKILERWSNEENKTISQLRVRDKTSDIAEGGSIEILEFHVKYEHILIALEILGEASFHGHSKMVEHIWNGQLKKAQEPSEDFDATEFVDVFRASLILATRQGHVETVGWLLDRIGKEALANCKNSIWETEDPTEMNLLAMAIDTGSKEMTKFLLEKRPQMDTDVDLWPITNLGFSSADREMRKSDLEDYLQSLRLNATSLAYKNLTMAPQWVADETLKVALAV